MERDEGSKRHVQDAVADRPNELATAIGDALPALRGRPLTWVSPLAADDYKEFKDRPFLDALGLGSHREALPNFWPRGGPNWDALAKVDGGGVVLVEAKAHVTETPTPDRSGAIAPMSVALIATSMLRARAYLGVPATAPAWPEHHYQIGNRLAHLYWLHAERRVPAWLVFLGFTGSPRWPRDPLTAEVWTMQVAGWMATLGVPKVNPISDRIGVAILKV